MLLKAWTAGLWQTAANKDIMTINNMPSHTAFKRIQSTTEAEVDRG